jgi:hypothetical protein
VTIMPIFTPHACARDKIIGFVRPSVCLSVRQHKNRQIWTSRHLRDS